MKHLAISLLITTSVVYAEFYNDFQEEPHNYRSVAKRDPVTRLLDRIQAGETAPLNEANGKPLVSRLLKELDIPVESQVMVFTKTSLQRAVVNPGNPRAIYFNEDVYLGWMPGGRIEIGSIDPWMGSVFFFQRELDDTTSPVIAESGRCMGCHAGSATNYMPGPLGRSIYPAADGRSLRSLPHELAGHEVPMDQRWGGWYVTGQHGEMRHLGNAIATRENGQVRLDMDEHANLASLSAFIQPEAFPFGAKSDILALLILDHQIGIHNQLMEAHYKARQAIFDYQVEDASQLDRMPEDAQRYYHRVARKLTDYLLFKSEASLGPNQLQGNSAYQEVFLKDRRQTSSGLSLKDLKLNGHMFENRCSYMIYSEAFTKLPGAMKQAVYQRIREILTSPEPIRGFDYLSDEERARIGLILSETIPEFLSS
tara:strand:- start:2012 stop:3286 length:1275 start_codon:yes stop_codon:yes gene_type:complete